MHDSYLHTFMMLVLLIIIKRTRREAEIDSYSRTRSTKDRIQTRILSTTQIDLNPAKMTDFSLGHPLTN